MLAEMNTENKVENEIMSASRKDNAREEAVSKTGNAERAEQPLSTCTFQDRKAQKGELN